MMTLDDVIEAMERCSIPHYFDCKGCPYEDDDAEVGCRSDDRDVDALHYLREFQGLSKMWNDKLDKEQANPALTWSDLQQMEGKPVWVEQHHGDTKGWLLILRKCDDVDVVTCTTKHGNSFYLYKANYGEKWQAYRKERTDGLSA